MTAAPHSREPGRPPRPVRSDLWLFAPNRDNQGGSAWFLEHSDGDLLVDVPAPHAGIVEEITVTLGERFDRGAVLARLVTT